MILIEKGPLQQQFENLAKSWRETFSGPAYANALRRLENAPIVDAVPVVHGRWIETEEGTICSECHNHPFEDGEYAIANYNGNYCPNCGAKMDGGNEDG